MDESLKAAAKRETVEESGVRGKIEVSATNIPYRLPYIWVWINLRGTLGGALIVWALTSQHNHFRLRASTVDVG